MTIISLCVNIIFYKYRRREYSLKRIKILVLGILTCITILLITNVPFFILHNSDSFLDKAQYFFIPTLLFNLANMFYSASVILFLLSFFQVDDNVIDLDLPSKLLNKNGNIMSGWILKGKAKKHKFYLALKDLEKHMFICGATGTGKTNFLQHFLINFTKKYKIPFMLVEFKGEYHFLQKKIENLLIIRPGENFSINIFNSEGVLPEIHAERIFDILKSGKFLDESAEFTPQMEKVLVEILTKVCKNKKFQSWEGFYQCCKGYATNKQNQIPMLSQTLISITNRIRRFSLGSLKAIFDTDHKLKVKDLFKRNVLFDLSSIIRLGGEKEDALFFLNMILKYLWDKNLTCGAYKFQGIKHITIIEDIQYFAPKEITRQSKLTTYLEDIALLQRGTGECLISLATHPDISEEILANCGVLVCFKTHMEKEVLCKLLNLDSENEDYLSILEEGQCIVRVNSIKRPFVLSVPLINREWLKPIEINQINESILNNNTTLKNDKIKKKKFKPLQFFKNLSKIHYSDSKKSDINLIRIKQEQKKNGSNVDHDDIYEFIKDNKEIETSHNKFDKLKDYLNKLYIKQEEKE
ncbi:MAG: ATP-binding protein [Promethearchaeota archaeon]|nr:MAG: ATP-binding protein [Candidatus Lokiarchaeota archaeon]